jgi:3-hydroxyisobutyrate dehydrogenase-like beta-hydroxyacid dehydrogenase
MTRIALVSAGALGACVGTSLARAGHEVRCDVSERSLATRRRAAAAGLLLSRTPAEAILASEVVLSLVPPAEAIAVAVCFARSLRGRGRADRKEHIFIDGNSVSPRTAVAIEKIVAAAGARMADASFFGPANSFDERNMMVLSGRAAYDAAALFKSLVADIRVIDGDVGAASAVKMAISILTKTLPAIFLEAARASAASGQLDVTLDLLDRLYPGITSFLARTLPTYRQHTARRLDEMREIESWLGELGQPAAMIRSGRETLVQLASSSLPAEECRGFRETVAALVAAGCALETQRRRMSS